MTATVEFVCYRCQIRMKNNGDAATYVKSLYVCGQIDRSKRLDRVVLGLFIKTATSTGTSSYVTVIFMSLFFNTANGLWTHCFHSLSLSYLSYLASISTAQMGRGRIQLKRIENNINRQVTFSKRRSGLMKKAHEISVLCDVEVAVIIFSTKGKLYEYSTDSSMEKILDRYERFCYAGKDLTEASLLQSDGEAWCLQYHKLKRKAESLQKNERNLIGEDLDSLTAKELHNLELRVEDGLRKIKAQKNNVLFDSIADLKIKEKMLQQQNSAMERKLKSERAAAAAAVATARTLQREQVKQQRLKSTSSVVPNLNIGYLI